MNSQRETKNIVQFAFYKTDIYSIKNYHYDITALLLKVALNTINHKINRKICRKQISVNKTYVFH